MEDIFKKMDEYSHEQLIFYRNKDIDLKAIIALHDSFDKPSLGGTRIYPYETIDKAVEDVLRLSSSMSLKCALAGVDFVGGKMVVIGEKKSKEMFRLIGKFIEGLNGKFFTGTDMGTLPEDFVVASYESKYIVGLPLEYGGSGDTSIFTALGVVLGMKATCKYLWKDSSLNGKLVAIQGLGKVGFKVLRLLLKEKASCIVTDINEARLKDARKLQALGNIQIVEPEEIYKVSCDIFSPCSIGGILNRETVNLLKCKAIVGSANDQLEDKDVLKLLKAKKILYAPDYVVNLGGLIQVAQEIKGFSFSNVRRKIRGIFDTLLKIYKLAEKKDISTCKASKEIAYNLKLKNAKKR